MTALPIRHYATTIGDGASQRFEIHHGLDTRQVMVEVLDADTFQPVFDATTEVLDRNTVAVDFTHQLVYTPKRGILGKIKPKGNLDVLPGRVPDTKSLRVLVTSL